ncbi:shikimate kinase [Nautilia lithotrophica]
MQVNNTNLHTAIQVDVQKKAQDVVKNVLGSILEKTFENTKKIEEMAASSTGKGMNLNIKA